MLNKLSEAQKQTQIVPYFVSNTDINSSQIVLYYVTSDSVVQPIKPTYLQVLAFYWLRYSDRRTDTFYLAVLTQTPSPFKKFLMIDLLKC